MPIATISPIRKLSVEDFKIDEVQHLLAGKVDCNECKHCAIYKGPRPLTFPRHRIWGKYYRMYCKLRRTQHFNAPKPLIGGFLFQFYKKIWGTGWVLPSVLMVKQDHKCLIDMAHEKVFRKIELEEKEKKLIAEWKGTSKTYFFFNNGNSQEMASKDSLTVKNG